MGYIYRPYIYLVISYLLYNLFDDIDLNVWWNIFILFPTLFLFGINRDWFQLRTFRQTFIILLATAILGVGLYHLELITKIILLIIAFLLFIISNYKPYESDKSDQKNIEFRCRNCHCNNLSFVNEWKKLEAKKCNQCNYYNYIKAFENGDITVVRAVPDKPYKLIVNNSNEENKMVTFSGKFYSFVLTLLILLSFYK
jgi:hypothetical protein